MTAALALPHDPIVRLGNQGRITRAEQRAADEMRHAERIGLPGACMSVAAWDASPRAGGTPIAPPAAWHGDGAMIGRYRLWRCEAAEMGWPLEPVLVVIVGRKPIRCVERAVQMRHGLLAPIVIAALGLYVGLAGWSAASRAASRAPDAA